MKTDVRVANHGSICLLHLETRKARSWGKHNLPDDALEFGGAVVVEPRFLMPIVEGMREDGLRVSRY